MKSKQYFGRYSLTELLIAILAVVLAVASLVWFTLGTPGHRQGAWLLIPVFALCLLLEITRRRRLARAESDAERPVTEPPTT